MQCINAMLTLEHLSLICQKKATSFDLRNGLHRSFVPFKRRKSSCRHNKSFMTDIMFYDIEYAHYLGTLPKLTYQFSQRTNTAHDIQI